MSSQRFPLSELEIIGYADYLSQEFVPQIVPPIFRQRDATDRVVMPPFLIEGGEVIDAVGGFASDFDSAVLRGQATRHEKIIAARPGYRLWVDETFEPHYEPSETASERLREIAHSRVSEAQRALLGGHVAEAMRLAQIAISADDGCLNAILVKALAHRLEGDQASVEVLTDIAEIIVPGADLQSWIDFFAALVLQQTTRDAYRSGSYQVSMIAETGPSYGARSEELGWLGVGGDSDFDDPGSIREISDGLLSRFQILSEIDPDLGDELASLVM